MDRKFIILVGLIALLVVAAPVLAGGWVVITIDALPGEIHAGEPIEISFMVRQHGETPTHDLSPLLMATNTATGERIQVEAEKALETGRFIVKADFPSSGIWEWAIDARPFNQVATLAPITVLAPELGGALQQGPELENFPSGTGAPWQAILRWGGLSLLAVGLALVIFEQRRRREVPSPVSGD